MKWGDLRCKFEQRNCTVKFYPFLQNEDRFLVIILQRYIATSGTMIDECWNGKDLEGRRLDLIDVLS
jgi:hypothetical protein